MSQNTSHAVMAQRSEPHDSLDDFPTPPWGTRALLEKLDGEIQPWNICWEPACNRGYMTKPLREFSKTVIDTDIHNYGVSLLEPVDFLWPTENKAHWIITNPPFRLAEQFIETALERATRGVAILCRSSFSEGVGRYNNLFSERPPTYIWQFSERLPMVKGRVDGEASTATSYAWYVWIQRRKNERHTFFDWIAPCRKRLEREGDYDS